MAVFYILSIDNQGKFNPDKLKEKLDLSLDWIKIMPNIFILKSLNIKQNEKWALWPVFAFEGGKMEYLNEYKKWCTSDVFDEETKKELINIKNDNKEIEDFYKKIFMVLNNYIDKRIGVYNA